MDRSDFSWVVGNCSESLKEIESEFSACVAILTLALLCSALPTLKDEVAQALQSAEGLGKPSVEMAECLDYANERLKSL